METKIDENNLLLSNALKEFRRQYPASTSGDMQTFILGWKALEEWKPSSKVIKIEAKKIVYRHGMELYPNHKFVNNWQFDDGEEPEALLAYAMAVVAEKNSMNKNDLKHLFPGVLRMLKSKIKWTGL